jgi:hypothetical protein
MYHLECLKRIEERFGRDLEVKQAEIGEINNK